MGYGISPPQKRLWRLREKDRGFRLKTASAGADEVLVVLEQDPLRSLCRAKLGEQAWAHENEGEESGDEHECGSECEAGDEVEEAHRSLWGRGVWRVVCSARECAGDGSWLGHGSDGAGYHWIECAR